MKIQYILFSILAILVLALAAPNSWAWPAGSGYVCDEDPADYPDQDWDYDELNNRYDDCPTKRGLRIFAGCPDTDGDGIQDYKQYYRDTTCLMHESWIDFCPITPGPGVNDIRLRYWYPGLGCPNLDCDARVESHYQNFVDEGRDFVYSSYGMMLPPWQCPGPDSSGRYSCVWNTIRAADGSLIFPDRDCDGVLDADELFADCVGTPGPKGAGGCPDQDLDNVPDRLDRCPTVAGLGGPLVGCPENDPDGDGFLGTADRCPDMPGEARWNGCPALDADGDGIRNDTGADHCPELAGVAEYDGCPANDRDGDGVLNADDACPDVAGEGGLLRGCETLAAAGIVFEPREIEESGPVIPEGGLEPWRPPLPDFGDIRPEPLLPIEPEDIPHPEEEGVAPEEEIAPEGGAEPLAVGEEGAPVEAPEGAVSERGAPTEGTVEDLGARSTFGGGRCTLASAAVINPVSFLFLILPVAAIFIRRKLVRS